MEDIRLVQLAQLYLYVNFNDWTYTHLMSDPRAREVAEADAPPLWHEYDMWPMPPWRAGMKGLPSLTWATLHCYQHGIDFDFLDIGANIGIEGIAQATLHKRCGWPNQVYLFEPGSVAELTEKSVHKNRVPDVATIVRAAATDHSGTENFYVLPKASGGSSLLAEKVFHPSVNTEVHPIQVATVTVDDFVRQNMRPAPALIIKIDTAGADFKVLAGMRETMIKRMVIAQVEIIPSLVETYTSAAGRLTELARDFVLVIVGHGEERRIVPREAVEHFVDGARGLSQGVDICLIPRRLPYSANLLECIMNG